MAKTRRKWTGEALGRAMMENQLGQILGRERTISAEDIRAISSVLPDKEKDGYNKYALLNNFLSMYLGYYHANYYYLELMIERSEAGKEELSVAAYLKTYYKYRAFNYLMGKLSKEYEVKELEEITEHDSDLEDIDGWAEEMEAAPIPEEADAEIDMALNSGKILVQSDYLELIQRISENGPWTK